MEPSWSSCVSISDWYTVPQGFPGPGTTWGPHTGIRREFVRCVFRCLFLAFVLDTIVLFLGSKWIPCAMPRRDFQNPNMSLCRSELWWPILSQISSTHKSLRSLFLKCLTGKCQIFLSLQTSHLFLASLEFMSWNCLLIELLPERGPRPLPQMTPG